MTGKSKIKNDFMVIHRYQNIGQSTEEDEINEFLVNKAYECQIVMTNISPKRKQITLLYQVPNGSLPIGETKYINSQQYTLQPYTSQKCEIQFYFPYAGLFKHQPSNISENLLVIAKSQLKQIEVREKRVINNIEIFEDLMKTTRGAPQKRAIILDILKNDLDKMLSPKFKFNKGALKYYMQIDADFFQKVFEILERNSMLDYISDIAYQAYSHRHALLTLDQYKSSRPSIMALIQTLIQSNGRILDYIFKPIKSQIIDYSKHELFDFENPHLEYFPMVNQRVFSIGKQETDE